jgi:hypothetical protein
MKCRGRCLHQRRGKRNALGVVETTQEFDLDRPYNCEIRLAVTRTPLTNAVSIGIGRRWTGTEGWLGVQEWNGERRSGSKDVKRR